MAARRAADVQSARQARTCNYEGQARPGGLVPNQGCTTPRRCSRSPGTRAAVESNWTNISSGNRPSAVWGPGALTAPATCATSHLAPLGCDRLGRNDIEAPRSQLWGTHWVCNG